MGEDHDQIGVTPGGRIVRSVREGIRIERLARYVRGGMTNVGIFEEDFEAMVAHLGTELAQNEIEKSRGRRVHVHSFAMDMFPVTRKEFLSFVWDIDRIVVRGPRRIDIEYWRQFDKQFEYPDDAPIVKVSFMEATLFAWFKGGRLPTEEEWELAARGHNLLSCAALATRPGINSYLNLNSEERAFEADDNVHRALKSVTASASAPSPFGILDMLGNANEWVNSCFDVRSTVWAGRMKNSSDQWLAGLSKERILKHVGLSSRFPHPGRRSVFDTEFRFPKSYCSGGVSRETLAGFRCCYDV